MREDVLAVSLGQGGDAWRRARRAINDWRQFDLGWVSVATGGLAPHSGQDIVVIAQRFGVNVVANCRVIRVHDIEGPTGTRYGFTYGTLTDHPERGEERFEVLRLPGGEVRYRIHAMAAPAIWYSRLARPLVEIHRRRFRSDSAAAMRRAVATPR